MKPKTIHRLYSEDPNGTPEEFPEKFQWLERCIRSLLRTKANSIFKKEDISSDEKTPKKIDNEISL